MATKPTIADARWATDGAAELTAPSSGERDSGFVGGTPAVADYANVLHKEAYKWAQYVDEGILTGALHLNSAIAPAAITGSNDNYNPTGWSTGTGGAQVIRQDLSAAATLTGLAGGATGRIAIIRNLNATYDLKLTHDATSTAANRFQLPEAKDLYLVGAQSYVVLQYDATLSRWVVIATNGRQPKTLWLHSSNFMPSEPATDVWIFDGPSALNNSGGGAGMQAPLMLPVGTRLTAITYRMITGAVNGPHNGALEYADLATATATSVGTGNTGTESSNETFTLSGMPHTMLDFPYTLAATLQDGDQLTGVKVEHY